VSALSAASSPAACHAFYERDQWPGDRAFVVLAPQFGPTPSNCTDPELIDEYLRFAIEHYDVDESRVYLTGVSCGAFGSWDYLGAHTDEVVAAAVLFAGDGRSAFDSAGCELGRVPIWALHGGADTQVDAAGSEEPINALNDCEPPPVDARMSIYPGVGHAMWQPFYDGSMRDEDIYAWMLQYTNPSP
jgi:predicted peptidase